MKKNSIMIFLVLTAFIFAACPPSGKGEKDDSGGVTVTKTGQGKHDGYDWEFWLDDRGGGSAKMILKEGGTFSCQWTKSTNASEPTNFLARKGFKLGSVKAANEYSDISVTYSTDYQNQTGQSYMCVYGWTKNPLMEYYILDDFKVWNPAQGATKKGSFTVDGGTYDIYVSTRTDQPSIEGTKTFPQYWSIRTNKRQSGTISVSDHFTRWDNISGMNMSGKLYEVSFCIEGYNSNGKVNVTQNDITITP